MKTYLDYSYYTLLHAFRKFGNPSYSAGAALGLIWAVNILFLLELIFFDSKYPNPTSTGVAFIIFFIIFLTFWKSKIERQDSQNQGRKIYPKYYKLLLAIQILLALAGFGWYILKYLFI